MARHRDMNWGLAELDANKRLATAECHLAVLMDIREALWAIRRELQYQGNMQRPILNKIDKRLAKKIKLR